MAKKIYSIEEWHSGTCYTLQATSYREARKIAYGCRNGYNDKVVIIDGDTIEYGRYGFPENVLDTWMKGGDKKWTRVNP